MTMTIDQLRGVMLDLIAPLRIPDPAILAALGDGDWAALVVMGHQHRVLPLVHARLGAEGVGWPVPDAFRTTCAESFRGYSFRAIRSQRVTALAVRTLAERGIEAIPLKGAWLAFHAYPQPGLRPLPDIDLLVPEGRALEAFGALRESGLDLLNPDSGDPVAALAAKHQLPPLWSTQDEVCVELHHRCFHGHGSDPDLTDDPHFRGRLVPGAIAQTPVRYMGPEHLLLHLIVHSAHDHRFDNGPGIFADVAALLARQPLATVRHAWLALALAGAATVLSGAWVDLAGPGPGVASLTGVVLGLVALSGRDLGRWLSIGLAVLAGIIAGLAIDLPTGARTAGLGAFGGAVGIALAALLVWGLVDGLQHRFGRVAGAVAASWVAAVGRMAAAFSFAGAA